MKNLKINPRAIAAIAGISIVLGTFSSCSKSIKKDNETITGIIEAVEDDTCFDECIEQTSNINLEDINVLEDYIYISEELNKTKFNKIAGDSSELMNSKDIYTLISLYNDKKYRKSLSKNKLELLEKKLTTQEMLVNEYIYSNGYDMMAEASSCGIKSCILDAKDLDESNYQDITIPGKDESGYQIEEATEFGIDGYQIKKTSDLGELLVSLYEMQEKGIGTYKTNDINKYNEYRNKLIIEDINNLKKVLKNNYKIKNKKIREDKS